MRAILVFCLVCGLIWCVLEFALLSLPLGVPVARIELVRIGGRPDAIRVQVDMAGGYGILHIPGRWREVGRTMRYTTYADGDTLIGVAWAVQDGGGIWRCGEDQTKWVRASVKALNDQ